MWGIGIGLGIVFLILLVLLIAAAAGSFNRMSSPYRSGPYGYGYSSYSYLPHCEPWTDPSMAGTSATIYG